jgi:molybdopterin-guanine dinucleotide biosynthesis protein A
VDGFSTPVRSPQPDAVAVVLAGGEGRRMGGDKPLRPFGGARLIDRALALAQGYCLRTAVAVRRPGQIPALPGALLLLDPADLPGPLAGLASALAFARAQGAPRVLTLPCDTPRLPADLLARLAAALDGAGPARVAVARSGGRLHPACALWPADGLEALGAYAAAGRASLRGFAVELGMGVVDWDAPGGDPFANANTPAELALLQPA